MPYVPVPKDLSRVKNKIAFNLTRRQLVCFALAGAVGIPFYLFSRSAIGTDADRAYAPVLRRGHVREGRATAGKNHLPLRPRPFPVAERPTVQDP